MNQAPVVDDQSKASPYAWYVLFLLVLVYVLNFVDRSIITILAPDIKRDLGIADDDIGFLYGTAFGVFYALFGIPLGKLADSWRRVSLLSLGLSLWSAMTMVSGFAGNFAQLALARIGVGVGEATAGPCAYSLITDWFPKRNRATAIAIYTSGLYLGGGLSLYIGALVVKAWDARYAIEAAPLGLAGWQAAFLAVGFPGLLLALWVATLREPLRGQFDGLASPVEPHPFRVFFNELCMVLPPLTLWSAYRQGRSSAVRNLLAAAVIVLVAWALIAATGSYSQWIVMGIGVYAVYSWATTLKHRDPVAFELIWGTPAFLCIVIGYGLISFNGYAVGAFAPTYAVEHFKATQESAGFIIGGSAALGGVVGVIGGGLIADRLRKFNPAGRVITILASAILSLIPFVVVVTTDSLTVFYALFLPMTILSSAALAPAGASIVDLVLPRMRGTATAAFFIGTTLIGLALGPYTAGLISRLTGSLGTGLLSMLAVAPISLGALIAAYYLLPKAEATLLDRARAAGEKV